MIDAEKLLGKVLSGAMQSTGKKKKQKKRKKSDDFLGGLVRGLTSGKGLVTAIGLGVGAYEIYKQQSGGSQSQAIAGNVPPQSMPPVPPQPPTPGTPPPIPRGATTPPEMPVIKEGGEKTSDREQDLAVRLIQTMVAAAHADGELDQQEEIRILEKLQEQGLDKEEKQYILMELHAPKTIAELTLGLDNPMVAQTMYSLAVSTIVVDTVQEREWLDELARALNISTAMQGFVEEEL